MALGAEGRLGAPMVADLHSSTLERDEDDPVLREAILAAPGEATQIKYLIFALTGMQALWCILLSLRMILRLLLLPGTLRCATDPLGIENQTCTVTVNPAKSEFSSSLVVVTGSRLHGVRSSIPDILSTNVNNKNQREFCLFTLIYTNLSKIDCTARHL